MSHIKIPAYFLLVTLVVSSIHCKSADSIPSSGEATSSINPVGSVDTNILNQLYTDRSLLIVNSATLIEGKSRIFEYFNHNQLFEDTSHTIYSIPAINDSSIIYEINGMMTADHKNYKRLIIWNTQAGTRKKELEYLAISTQGASLDPILLERREAWMKWCNQHQVDELVKQLYAPQAIYYNHKPAVRGTEAIINEYQYMNNPKYNLTLNPLTIIPVNENEIFEIGQCTGSYGGKYILIWQKNDLGIWKVVMDANI